MPNETTLKQALTTYTKKELVIIAENQGIKSPNKLKKAKLIQTL